MKKSVLYGGLLALVGVGTALAGGQFIGYPVATSSPPSGYATTYPLTGNETIPADTQLSQGIMPQTEVITTAQLATFAAGYNTTFRNVLIGGDFGTNPWQRGTSGFGDIASTLTYGADRWYNLGGASSAINVSKQTGASDVFAGTGATLRFQRKSANADTAVICTGQVIETVNSLGFAGNTAVFSFTSKIGANFSAANNAVNVTIAYGTGTNETSANFNAGSWTGYTAPTQYVNGVASTTGAVTLTTSFVRNVVTAAIPSTATQIGVKICYTPVGTASTNDWFEFGQAQLEATTQAAATAVPSVFEALPSSIVLERAQRYAYVLTESAAVTPIAMCAVSTTSLGICNVALPTTMRTVPTMTYATGWAMTVAAQTSLVTCTGNGTPTAVASTAQNATMLTVTCTSSAGFGAAGTAAQLFSNGGSGKITASADI